MMMRAVILVVAGLLCAGIDSPLVANESPYILLGSADQLALDQPRISVELIDPATGRVIGPDLASTFLLDTGANSVLAVDDAVAELNQNGYRTEGTFFEQGVAGFTEFDVSALYRLRFTDSNSTRHVLENSRILSSTKTSFCPIPGLCSFFGVAGMPIMIDRVTTLDVSNIGGPDVGDDIFEGLFDLDFMHTSFSGQLPTTTKRRYSVAVTPSAFRPEGNGPLPSWADLPFLSVDSVHKGQRRSGNFILDTGAQLSIISSDLAFRLGLDENGNGILEDEAVGTQPIGGIGGQIDAPLMQFDAIHVPTEQGIDLVFADVTVAVLDIDPSIDGIFGMNFLSSGWLGAAFGGLGDLGELADLLEDAGLADLLESLGGLGAGGEGSPYPFFEQIHFDFRNHRNGQGRIYFDLTDDVTDVVVPPGSHGDLDHDGDIDFTDRTIWVHEVNNTYFGDSNLDGAFNSRDLVNVFQAGEFEDGISKNSNWSDGDWDGNCEFDTADLVLAFQMGAYESLPRAATVHRIPEPTSTGLLVAGMTVLFFDRRRFRCANGPEPMMTLPLG
jgi:hypothetical protein